MSITRSVLFIPALLAIASIAPRSALALGDEKFGNKPVTGQPGWAGGVLATVNLKSRVYSYWVNGNESFFFRGGTKELNEALAKFAAIDTEVREVFILPRRGGTRSFNGTPVACDWELKVPGGIFLAIAGKDTQARVHPVRPTLFIFAGSRNLKLEELDIPSGVNPLGVSDLVGRYLEGLKSTDHHTAGAAAHLLGSHVAAVDSLEPLLAGLDHESDYVRVSAAGALGRFGTRAREALPFLRECGREIREGYKKSVRRAIEAIERAEETNTAGYRGRMKRVRAFLDKTAKLASSAGKGSIRDGPLPKSPSN